MSAIKFLNDNEIRRDPVSSDRTTVYTDGYKNLITSASSPSIADVISASGVVTLTNQYLVGTDSLHIYVNGQRLVQPGVDYTELSLLTFQLSAGWLAIITADPTNSTILIEWNRPLPGARDQEFNHLQNCTPAIEGAILDNDAGGPYRISPATAANPLATIADAVSYGGGSTPIFSAGFTGDGSDSSATFDVGGSPHTLQFSPGGKQYTNMTIDVGAVGHRFCEINGLAIFVPVPAEMPFADHGSVVAGSLHEVSEGWAIGGNQMLTGTAEDAPRQP